MKTEIFITHLIPPNHEYAIGFNDILIDQLSRLETNCRITVIYYASDSQAEQDLITRIPSNISLIKNDRPGRPDILPSMRNKTISLALNSDAKYIVMLHNDVRPARMWLDRLVSDIEIAEQHHGKDQVIVAPRYVPYHYLTPIYNTCPKFWEMLKNSNRVLSMSQINKWTEQHGFTMDEEILSCPDWSPPIENGHQLMMWITSPKFFDIVGQCDESFMGVNHDDQDWGIRALISGKHSYQSRSAIVGHIEGLTFDKTKRSPGTDNAQIFIRKWGRAIFDEMQTGAIWPRLHRWNKQGVLDVSDIFWLVAEGQNPSSFMDVGTGRNGVVGMHYWDRLPGRKLAIDIHSIKSMSHPWEAIRMDARELLSRLGSKSIDVVQACDFIEHLSKDDGRKLLADFETIARKAVLLFTPIGETKSPAELTEPDNPYQKHLSGWTHEELELLGYTTDRHIENSRWRSSAITAWKVL